MSIFPYNAEITTQTSCPEMLTDSGREEKRANLNFAFPFSGSNRLMGQMMTFSAEGKGHPSFISQKRRKDKKNPLETEEIKLKIPSAQRITSQYITVAKKMCLQCSATATPQWRSGPLGRGSLCNACGLCYGKSIKRAKVDGISRLAINYILNDVDSKSFRRFKFPQ